MSLKFSKFKKSLIISIILVILFFISNHDFSFSHAQINGNPFSFSSNFEFIEYCQIEGVQENVSSIDIDLPEPNWTISDIQVNFSDISLGSEIMTIEESETGLEQVWNKNSVFRNLALGMQIEILEVTDLLGVYIKGYITPEANETIKFQLQGYDEINFNPNGTIYRSIDLNMSTSLDWYYQDFSSNPIALPIGNYSLVMNGTSLPTDDKAKYFWQIDNLDPEIPFLHTSSYITSWDIGTVNSSLLCKLKVSKPNQLYFPSELNMTAQFNGDNYQIIDGLSKGDGILNLSDLTYFSEEIDLNIPIMINQSLILNYNYNFSVNLRNNFSTIGSAVVKEDKNDWSLLPTINRITSNYYVKFNFPKNWYNLTLYRKTGLTWENVTMGTNINFDTSTFIILNSTILDGAEFKITANSPNTLFSIGLPVLEWQPGQMLEFTVNTPNVVGNLTFFLINPLDFGYENPIDIKEDVSGSIYFSYVIPSNSRQGTFTIIIYWNNHTDAGIQLQNFQVNIPPYFDPMWVVIPIIATIGAVVIGIFSYRTIKKYRIRKFEEEQKIFNKCMDVLNLDYIIVSDKKSGLNVYQQSFKEKQVDAAMISGFLQAIHSFGIELIKVENTSQTIKLEYKDSIIIMTEFVNLRLILIMKEPPSANFFYALEDLAYDIYKYYGKFVEDFTGDIKPFKSIEKLLRHHLNTTITYPMTLSRIEKLAKVRISPAEREYINKATAFMKRNSIDHFYLTSILHEKECNPKDLEIIYKLQEKNIFQYTE
ncbi:MAG: hypothetical protein ACFE9Z_08235 [Promethearchaeota archaeon]